MRIIAISSFLINFLNNFRHHKLYLKLSFGDRVQSPKHCFKQKLR
jgi:hypothetical protein